jgi:hypothetical protein
MSGALGAARLVLIKPSGAKSRNVDSYFEQALPAGVEVQIVTADDQSERQGRS